MSQQKKTMLNTYSKVTQALLRNAMAKYDIRESDGPVVPGPKAHIRNPSPGKIGIYLEYFECGLRIPVTKFVDDLLSFYKIHLCQLKPNSICRIVVFELLANAYHVRHNPDRVLLFRIFYRISLDGDWYNFSQRSNMPALTKHARDSIKGWKEKFIWVNEDSVPSRMEFRSGDFENGDQAIDYTKMGPVINTAVNAYSAHPVKCDKFPDSVLTIGGLNLKFLREHKDMVLSLYVTIKGKEEGCLLIRALENGYTEKQLTLSIEPRRPPSDLVGEEDGGETDIDMCGKDCSTELLSPSPVYSASPSSKPRKKRSFQSIVRNSFTLLGGSRAPPVSASSPAPSLAPPPMVTMVGPPPTFGVGYAPGTSSLGFAGCSSSVSGPDSIFRPSWTLAHDADGQDQAFASQFAQHAFPPAMVSRFDGLDYSDVQTQYYSHATNTLACAASLARRNEKERSDAQKRVEVAEAQARKYKSAYDEVTDQMSTLRFERDGLVRREERYVETEKSHMENMDWMLHHGIRDTFQHCFTSAPFVDNALSLYQAIEEAGAEKGARDTRDKFNLSFPDEEIPGYQRSRRGGGFKGV